jgi:uncharacterized protein (DUF2252 family)
MNSNLKKPRANNRAAKVIDALQKWNEDLSVSDRELKYCKMASSPFVFYRGTAHLFWMDFADDARLKDFGSAETRTWVQGDLHAYNYGSFDNAESEVVFDLNDFDECILADYQYDLWRMAGSIVLIARQNDDLTESQTEKVVDAFSESYRSALSNLRDDGARGIRFTEKQAYGELARFLRSVDKQYTRQGMLDKWASEVKKNKRRFNLDKRPDKLAPATEDQRTLIQRAMKDYRKSLGNKLGKNADYFKVEDIAVRLAAGTGSLGTARFYVLIRGSNSNNSDDNRILDVKQQSKPTPYDYLDERTRDDYDKDYGSNHARRHATAYKALTSRTDPHLGWMHLAPMSVSVGGGYRDCSGYYSVRERSPFKEAFPGEALDTRRMFSALSEQWAEVLATDHARANKDLPKLFHKLTDDRDRAFMEHVRKIAFSYADQVQGDWEAFVKALELKPDECGENAFVPPSYRDMLPR